jgi:hypothetical protein
MPKDQSADLPGIIAGVDSHKDLHVAAVVDVYDRFIASECFASTRQGYKKMLAWMQSFGAIERLALNAPAHTAQACCTIFRTPVFRFWKSPRLIRRTAVAAEKTIGSTQSTSRMPPFLVCGQSLPKAGMVWSKPCVS